MSVTRIAVASVTLLLSSLPRSVVAQAAGSLAADVGRAGTDTPKGLAVHAPNEGVPKADATIHDPAKPEVRQTSRAIELRAGHVEIEGPFNKLSLSEGVELTVNRYRVTAERLTLERTPLGILVEGDGRVAFCPCAGSPFTVGFSRGTVAPPTDLLLRQATFRACGVPVLWLPAYWVRSPNKVGLMSPTLGWRASDGPWVGTGVHVPLSTEADKSDARVELLVGAYLFGGVELGTQIQTSRTMSSARWDYRQNGMLEVESKGYRHWSNQWALAWQINALRGERGRTGPVDFESSSRNNDRLRAEVAFADGRALYGFGLRGDLFRATRFANTGQFGPSTTWGIGAALGSWGRADSSLILLGRLHQSAGSSIGAIHSSDLEFNFRPGPVTVRWAARERWLLNSGSERAFDTGLLGSELRIGLPLVRNSGDHSRADWSHWFEPFVVGTAAWRGYGAAYASAAAQPVGTMQLALLNKLFSQPIATTMSLQLRAGSIVESAQTTRAVAARWLGSGNWLALGGDVGWTGQSAWLSVLRARLGRVDRVSIRSRLEGRGLLQAAQLRWLYDEAWSPWLDTWYSRQGWVGGADLDLALGHQVAVTTGLTYDVGRSSLIAESAGASYRHPCGCLAVSSRAGWRAGREGLDLLLLLDLMP